MAELFNGYIVLSGLLIALLAMICHAEKELLCSVCHAVIDEINAAIEKIDPRKTIQMGSYHIDATGDQKKAKIPYAYSEMHLNDLLESLCSNMDDYAQAKYKDTGKRTVIKLIGAMGAMNPDIAKVDLQPDTELNSKLKFYCETIINEHEDDIIRMFTKRKKNPDEELCMKVSGYCSNEDEEYTFEKEEL